MSNKFYVEQSPCIEYEGSLSMTCPAGNTVVDRAPVWETSAPWETWYNLHQALPQVVCQVCDVLVGDDTELEDNVVTFDLTWGPNMVNGEINQADVQGYEVYWVDADDVIVIPFPVATVAKPPGESENVRSSCGCDAQKYAVSFVGIPVPTGAEGLLVVPKDILGFTMPVGRVARFTDTHTTSTTTGTSGTITTFTGSSATGTASSITTTLITGQRQPTTTTDTSAVVLPPTVNSKAPSFAQLSVTVLALIAAATTSA
jgi:hypothetical protein